MEIINPNKSVQPNPATGHSAGEDKAARKRENDRAYRERLKKGKIEMETKLKMLNGENQNLKIENESLKRENVSMNEVLKSQAKEVDQLKTGLDQLKLEYEKQNSLVQRFSHMLAFPDLQLENQRLMFENAQLRHTASLENNFSQLIEENERLELENRVLRVQMNALCGKIINDDARYSRNCEGAG